MAFTFKNPDYRSIGQVDAETCGEFIDMAGDTLTIELGDQPGFLRISGPNCHPFTLPTDDVCEAISIGIITRREAS